MWNISRRWLRTDQHQSLKRSDTLLLCPNELFLELLKLLRDMWRWSIRNFPEAEQMEFIDYSCKEKYQSVCIKSSTWSEPFSFYRCKDFNSSMPWYITGIFFCFNEHFPLVLGKLFVWSWVMSGAGKEHQLVLQGKEVFGAEFCFSYFKISKKYVFNWRPFYPNHANKKKWTFGIY